MTLFQVLDPTLASSTTRRRRRAAARRGSATDAAERWSPTTAHAARRDAPRAAGPTLATDGVFRIPAIRLAEAQQRARAGVDVPFTWETPVFGGVLRSTHALEIPFVFDNLDQPAPRCSPATGAERQAIADAMHRAWIAFARTGDPNHAGAPGLARVRHRAPGDDAVRRRPSRSSTTRSGEDRQAWGDWRR